MFKPRLRRCQVTLAAAKSPQRRCRTCLPFRLYSTSSKTPIQYSLSKLTLAPIPSEDIARAQVVKHLQDYCKLKFPKRVQESSDLLTAQENYILERKRGLWNVEELLSNVRVDQSPKDSLDRFVAKKHSAGWGFTIIRCTYQSQVQWEEFLSLVLEDLDFSLRHPSDATLRRELYLQVMEDKSLDALTWKEARGIFDKWVIPEMKKHLPSASLKDWPVKEDEIKEELLWHGLRQNPRWEVFVYANQESVDSITKAGKHTVEKRRSGSYFLNIVTTSIVPPRESAIDENGVWLKDDESDWLVRHGLRQKIKGYALMELFAALLGDLWPECYLIGKDGITDIW